MQYRRFMIAVSAVGILVLLALRSVPAAGQFEFREMRRAKVVRPGTIPTDLSALTWRHVGPQGNRVSAVAGDPSNPDIYYAGACAGGVWKSVDGGTNWEPVFDEQTSQSIGALA